MPSSTFDKIRETGKHALIYGAATTLTTAASVILIPVYTHYLPPAAYGALSLILITLTIFSKLFSMGIQSAFFRFYYESDEAGYQKKLAGTATIVLFSSCSAMILLGFFVSPYLSSLIFSTTKYAQHFMLMFFSSAFMLLVSLPYYILRAEKKSKQYAGFNIATFFLQVFLIIYFVVFQEYGIMGVILGRFITNFVFCVLAFLYTSRSITLSYSPKLSRELVRFGYPLVFAALAGLVLTYFDQYILQMFASLSEVGIYNLGYKIGMIIQVLLITPFITIWGPMKYSVRKEKNADQYYRKILTYFVAFGILLTLGISVFSFDILRLISPEEYWGAHLVIPLILLSYLFHGLSWPLSLGIAFEKKTEYYAYITFFGAGLNIGLNFLAIPRYGMMGAAFTTLLCYFLMVVPRYYYNQKFYPINYEWHRLAKIALVSVLLFIPGWFVQPQRLLYSIAYHAFILGMYPTLLYLVGFFQPAEIKGIKRIISGTLGRKKHNDGDEE